VKERGKHVRGPKAWQAGGARVEKRYFVANLRLPASPRIGTVSLWSLAWSSITVNGSLKRVVGQFIVE
jgi:hypothetical protein